MALNDILTKFIKLAFKSTLIFKCPNFQGVLAKLDKLALKTTLSFTLKSPIFTLGIPPSELHASWYLYSSSFIKLLHQNDD
jgi:hypothetical protein